MLTLFKKRPSKLLGIDIDSTSIKIVELSCVESNYCLEAYAIAPLPDGAVNEQRDRHAEGVAEAIQRTIIKAGITTKKSIAAVAGSSVFTMVVELEQGLSEEQMESIIYFKADQHIPFPLENAAIDFHVLGQSKEALERIQVLVAVCRKESVEQLQDCLIIAGLEPKAIDVEAYALERVYHLIVPQLAKANKNTVVALVKLGGVMMTLSVFSHGQTIYSREQIVGKVQFQEQSTSHYQLVDSEVLSNIEQSPLEEGRTLSDQLVEGCVEVQQIASLLQFFFAVEQHIAIDYVVLTGHSNDWEHIVQHAQVILGIPVVLGDPFAHMTINKNVDEHRLRKDAPDLMMACGLAMWRKNDKS